MALNSLITIRQRVAGLDAHGQALEGWQQVCTAWAEIRHLNGVEHIKAAAEVSAVQTSIKVRKRADITTAMQVVHGAALYDINAVLPDDVDRMHMYLVCTAGVKDGQ